MELYQYKIHELHDKLLKKEISAVEITKSVLKRANAVEDKIKAYITRTDDFALSQAEAVDKAIKNGNKPAPLAGIAGAIKDCICTKNIKTTCASKALSNFVPPYDAHVIEKLSSQGLVMTGKTILDEFGMGISSCGEAAAVASGGAIWALGSDTGGSVRQSATFYGLVGLKPTYGLVSRYGLVSGASSLDHIGPITRDVTDCALVMNAIAGYDFKDSTSLNTPVPDYTKALKKDVKGLKIGIPKEYFAEGLNEEVKNAVLKAIDNLKSLGASCAEVSLPHTKYAIPAYCVISCAETSSNLARFDGVGFGYRSKSPESSDNIASMYAKSRSESLGEEVKRRIIFGTYALSAGQYDAYYLKALKVRTLIKRDFEQVFEKVDVIITPATPAPAAKIGDTVNDNDSLSMYLQDVYTAPANLAGIPAISVPCGFVNDNLPVGFQIIGKTLDEMTILRAAYTFEQHHNYHNRIILLEGGAL